MTGLPASGYRSKSLVVDLVLGVTDGLDSVLKTASKTELNTAEEFKHVGGGNMLCSLVGSPPGYTDVVASSLNEEFGGVCSAGKSPATDRRTLTTSAVCGT